MRQLVAEYAADGWLIPMEWHAEGCVRMNRVLMKGLSFEKKQDFKNNPKLRSFV